MNKIQYIELLKLRGIIKLEKGQSIGDAVKQSGGDPTEKEMVLVNYNSMVYYIDKSKDSDSMQSSYQRQIEDLKHRLLKSEVEVANLKAKQGKGVIIKQEQIDELDDLRAWKNALQAAGVDNWEGYDIAMDMYREEVE